MAQTMEELHEVVPYVKNHNLGFTLPYTLDGKERGYLPDFIVRLDDGHGRDDLLNLILRGQRRGARKDKAAKVAAARNLWVPAVNAHGGLGRWAFIEIDDVYDAIGPIRGLLRDQGSRTREEEAGRRNHNGAIMVPKRNRPCP